MNKGIVILGKFKTEILIAEDTVDQTIGLMHRDPPLPCMAFPYKRPGVNKFWMSNTKAPLDIIFCFNNRIINISKGEPYSTKLVGPDEISDLVIELPYGTCEKLGLGVGNEIGLVK